MPVWEIVEVVKLLKLVDDGFPVAERDGEDDMVVVRSGRALRSRPATSLSLMAAGAPISFVKSLVEMVSSVDFLAESIIVGIIGESPRLLTEVE